MFTISAKGIYGISAVWELALRYNGEPVQIRDIANTQKIPQHYLEQILVVLKRGGVVNSVRGAQGGYLLANPPEKINLLNVLTLLEGPLDVLAGNRGDIRLDCLWKCLEESARVCLDKSLAELVEEIQAATSQSNYMI